MGAWIETTIKTWLTGVEESHPVWVRGLKHKIRVIRRVVLDVAPRVGAWIETFIWFVYEPKKSVAPRVGAWIETLHPTLLC